MNLDDKLNLEREWHDSEDFARDDNSLIVKVYASDLFAEAEAYHLSALGNIAGKKVLDYGCGTGETAIKLGQRGALVTGFDISQLRVSTAQERYAQAGTLPLARFVVCPAEQLPFDDASFDAILGKQILHHLELSVAIPEIARVLRPGGRAVFLEPLIHNPILEGYRRRTPHLRSPTEKALSMTDLARIGGYFSCWEHKEFCLFAVVPVVLAALTRPSAMLYRATRLLQRFDRRLMDTIPFVGRYAWETIIVLKR